MEKLSKRYLFFLGALSIFEILSLILLRSFELNFIQNSLSFFTFLAISIGFLSLLASFFSKSAYKHFFALNFVYFFLSYFLKKIISHDHLLNISFIEYLKHQGELSFVIKNSLVYFFSALILALVQIYFVYLGLNRPMRVKENSIGKAALYSLATISSTIFIVFPLYGYLNFTQFLSNATHRMIQFSGLNLLSNSRIYQNEHKTFVLVPMVHLAKKDFYKNVLNNYKDQNGVVLQEGVKDEKKLIKHDGSYKGLGKALGLDTQKDHFKLPEGSKLRFESADIDTSVFSPKTIKMINSIFKLTGDKNKNMANDFLEVQLQLANKKDMVQFFYEILELRNEALLKKIDSMNEKLIIIPWGALHLPFVEAELKKRGLVLIEENNRTVLSLAQLLKKGF